jgi:putative ABC transport system ATP-binding protein
MSDALTNDAVAIHARGLEKYYEGGRVHAVDGVDLDVAAGEFVAICGPSGCGKTTLLHLFSAIERPDAGSLKVAGQALADLTDAETDRFRRAVVGLVFQLHNLLPDLTALENVQVPMFGTRRSGRQRLERARELLERVGLTGRAHALPTVLSGGERQRVAIARALANEPRVLLADEPTGALDSRNGELLLDLLDELQREGGTTLVVVTHDPDIAARAGRVLHMLDGRIVDSSDADRVQTRD